MSVLFLTALLVAMAVVAMGVVADSGLRWWSAFRHLRQVARGTSDVQLPARRAAHAGTARPAAPRNGRAYAITSPSVRRAA